MPLSDHYGNPLSTASDAARTAYDRGVAHFLAATWGATDAFETAIAADPRFALAHVGLARARMMAGDMAGAKAAQAAAEALSGEVTDREAAHIAAVSALVSGDAGLARARVRAHALDFPRDVMVVQMCCNAFGLIGFSGETGREAELLAYTTSLMPQYEGDWWMMSMQALALCETGQLGRALDLMERSLELNNTNANGSHFKGHTLYEAGQTEAGLDYLQEWIKDYDRRGALHGHLSWHIALWALHRGDAERMWAVVDAGVGPETGHSLPINVLTDTAAICARAELAGHEVAPERWAALSDYAAQYFPASGQSFADMHAALAHAMAGEGTRLARLTAGAQGFAGDLVPPVARAWDAMARQDWAGAVTELTPVMAQTERIGGSRAQRDLLELAYVNALMRMGQGAEARRVLAARRPVLAEAPPLAALR